MIPRIESDLKKAMLAGERLQVSTLRLMKNALQNATIAARGELDEPAALKILSKESKQRAESAELYKKAGANDRAEAELAEKAIIDSYLPEAMTETELDELISQAITATGAAAASDMGKVMGWLSPKISGKADGKSVADKVKQALNQ